MKIALIGYGKMGHAIEALAAGRGHEIVATIDNEEQWASLGKGWPNGEPEVAIEFTTPATAVGNIRRCLSHNLPIVVGTTGWYDHLDEMRQLCDSLQGSLFVASNFSIGMNIMFELNERLATLMAVRTDYTVSITETHHIHKLDAPSGTAITLANQIKASRPGEVPIKSIREGEVPGTHTVVYNSKIDTLTLTHEAHSREGLATGALMAAEYLVGHKGYHTMKDLLRTEN